MKHVKLLAILILATMLFATVPMREATAAGTYSEHFDAYFAGTNALWWLSFGGINASSHLSALEAIPGVTFYNVTAIKTDSWVSDFQVFGENGYDLVPVPFVPSEGLFLTVGANSYGDAASAATALDAYLLTSLKSFSNGSGVFEFYSPLTFNSVVPKTLLTMLPSSAKGFASSLSATSFLKLLSPMVVVGGQRTLSGFSRSMALGSISNKGLNSNNAVDIAALFGSSNSSIGSSTMSTSSTVHLKFLDSIINSTDAATIAISTSPFSASYSLSLPPGHKVPSLNITAVSTPPQLLAHRVVDTGYVTNGQNVSISISLTNPSGSSPLTDITLDDNWWQGKGFSLVGGNSSVSVQDLEGGDSTSPTYVLQYTGNASEYMTIPPAIVRYRYVVGVDTFHGHAILNPLQISLGVPGPLILTYVTSGRGYGTPVGGTQTLKFTVKNVGTQTALSIEANGHSVSGIIPGGNSSFDISETSPGMNVVNGTKDYFVTYKTLAGVSMNATTNYFPLVFSHSSMRLAFLTTTVAALVSPLQNGAGTNLTLAFTVVNEGTVNGTSFLAVGHLPEGLPCGNSSGTGISCSGGSVSLRYASLGAAKAETTYMKFNPTNPRNYIIAPLSSHWSSSKFNLTGSSNAVAAPSGVVLSKSFSPNGLFPGMSAQVNVTAKNFGPSPLHNSSVTTSVDAFDRLSGTGTLSGSKTEVKTGEDVSFVYTVKALEEYGTSQSSPVIASFFFGGNNFVEEWNGPDVTIFTPASAKITSSPVSPTEGASFNLIVTVTNPSNVTISDVTLTLPIPSGLSLSQFQNSSASSGTLLVHTDSIQPRGTFVASASGASGSGIGIPFDSAKLSFSYSGTVVDGTVDTGGIVIGENVTTRYLIPTAIVFVVLLAAAFYIRSRAETTSPAVQS
ncbi:MAG: hypothetical protein HY296_06505 [Thaumarchaeota archaeon]|nr:hypothetical protein [Nitrososphaerota archaeon]